MSIRIKATFERVQEQVIGLWNWAGWRVVRKTVGKDREPGFGTNSLGQDICPAIMLVLHQATIWWG